MDNKVVLHQLHDLANFLIYKLKTSNIFNISLSMKSDEKSNNFDNDKVHDHYDTTSSSEE